MKLRAFRIKATGDALLLANERADIETTPVEVWVPRSVITYMKVYGLRPGQEGISNRVDVDIQDWFVKKNPQLENFKEV